MTPDYKRYSRNILVNKIGEKGQKKLFNSKVIVMGAGGLGSTVLLNLASLGIGRIGIVDNDIVEISNLNRQYIHDLSNLNKYKVDSAKKKMENYSKDIEIETFKARLSMKNYKDIIKDYEIIIDCFDSFESKFLLNDIAIMENIPLIHGGASEFMGQATVIIPNETPCLGCIFPDKAIGEEISKGVVSPTVSLIASVQSMETLKLILRIGTLLKGRMLFYDGLNQSFKTINTKKNQKCPVCSR